MRAKEALELVLLKLPVVGDFLITSAVKVLVDAMFKREKQNEGCCQDGNPLDELEPGSIG